MPEAEMPEGGMPGAAIPETAVPAPGTSGTATHAAWDGRRSAFVVSLDLEQAWGTEADRLDAPAIAAIHGARAAIPRMLDLADRYGIGFTWATVGLLFFGARDEMLAALPDCRPRYADPRLDAYARLPAVGRDERSDPLHFGRSLLLRIRDRPRHEIASHSFCHYYALEDGDDPAAFAADLAAATRAAAGIGVRLGSLVFPRNQVRASYLPLCAAAGLRAVRGTQPGRLHRARPRGEESRWLRLARFGDAWTPFAAAPPIVRPRWRSGLVDVPAARFLRPSRRGRWPLVRAQLHRIRHDMAAAARAGGVFHLWWHPQNFGLDTELNLRVLETILRTWRRLADDHGMAGMTMADVADTMRERTPPARALAS